MVAVVTRAIDVCISQRGGDPQGDITNAPDDVKDIEARRAAEDKHDIGPSTVEQKDQSKPGSAALSCRYCNKSYSMCIVHFSTNMKRHATENPLGRHDLTCEIP